MALIFGRKKEEANLPAVDMNTVNTMPANNEVKTFTKEFEPNSSLPIDPSKVLDQKINNFNGSLPPLPDLTDPNIKQQSIDVPSSAMATEANMPKAQELPPLDQSVHNQQSTQSQSMENLATQSVNNIHIDDLLKQAIVQGASDLHITVGYRAILRINGALKPLTTPIITREVSESYVSHMIKGRFDYKLETIREADMTYTILNRRFRVNIFKQMGQFSIVCRVIPESIVAIEELGLPPIVKDFGKFANGLVLVTGPTGSGKSTSIASILNLINLTQPKHIITLEDPIEFVFPKGMGLVDQREFGLDFSSWPTALRAILRQAPDIVLVGEMRDLDTVEAALQIAETGHLVLATLHTNSASSSIERIIDIFPESQKDQIKIQLASVLRAVLTQKLVPTIDGRRKIATEILISNAAVKNAIRENKGPQIDNVIQTSTDVGMISLEKSLVGLIREGIITVETAKLASTKPQEIDILLGN
jgi:twitching motility protein PilT